VNRPASPRQLLPPLQGQGRRGVGGRGPLRRDRRRQIRRGAVPKRRRSAGPLARYIDFRKAILQGALSDFTCLLGTMVQETYDSHPAIRAACDSHLSAHSAALAKDIADAQAALRAAGAVVCRQPGAVHPGGDPGRFHSGQAKQGPSIAGECLEHLRRYLVTQFHQRRRSTNHGPQAKDHPVPLVRRNAEEAMKHYTSIFKNSKIVSVTRYGAAGPGPAGSVMTGAFELEGQPFIALNGGPVFSSRKRFRSRWTASRRTKSTSSGPDSAEGGAAASAVG